METFKKLCLYGWRQFANVEIEFDSDVCVLTGSNGCGKTTILNVLARHFGWNINFVASPFFSKEDGKKIWTDIAKVLKNQHWDNAGRQEVGSIEYTTGQICKLVVPEQNQAQYSLQYQGQISITGLNIPSHRPVVSYFPIQEIPTNPKTNQQNHQEFQQLLFQAYGSDHVRNPGVILKQSLISLAVFGSGNEHVRANLEFKHLFDGFQDVLRIILPKSIGFLRLEIRSPDIVLITETGEFPLDAMSGGVSAIFGMAWQIHMYGADRTGITVIIDEPENHLHPSMQREFLILLRNAFPTFKFIVSTHSPFIISSDPNAGVYALAYDEQKRINSHKLTHADLSGSPNKILKEILGVPATIPIWVEEKIHQVLEKYKNVPDNEAKAKTIFNELKDSGLNNSLVDFLE